MVWNTSAFQLLIISATGGFTGLFTYSPIPGPGNLVASIAAAPGTDPYGNAYKQGVASYGGSGVVSFLDAGTAGFSLPATQSTPAFITTSGSPGVNTGLNITSGIGLEAGAAASSLSIGDSGVGIGLQVQEGRDGQTYNTEHKRQAGTGVPQLVNSVSDAPVTGLQRHVGIGTYHFTAKVVWVQGVVASNQQIGFTGPAVSSSSETMQTFDTSAITNVDARHNSSLITMVIGSAAFGAGDRFTTEIDGMATFTAAGTLSVGVACTNAANTFTVTNTESWLDVDPM